MTVPWLTSGQTCGSVGGARQYATSADVTTMAMRRRRPSSMGSSATPGWGRTRHSLEHNYKSIFGGACCGNCEKGKPMHAVHGSDMRDYRAASMLAGPVIIDGDKCPDGYELGKCYCIMCPSGDKFIGF